ncbi:toprim domain-containing protein [Staphylococcus aureus]
MAFNKKNFALEKKKELQEMTNNAVRRVLDFKQDPNKVIELLDFMARSPQYSFKNQMMVSSQYKNSNFTMGSRQFEESMGLKVKENAKPIKIVAPVMNTFFKRKDKLVQVRFASKEEKAKIKNKEIKTIQSVWYYKLVDVYDITQTNAKPEDFPEYYPDRRFNFYIKNPEAVDIIISANKKLLEENNIHLLENHNDNDFGTSVGFAGKNINGEIVVGYRDGLNKGEIMHTLLHETTHAFYHQKENTDKPTSQKEFEAEMTAYIVAKRFGIDTSEHTIKYVSNWTESMSNIENIEQSIKTVSMYSSRIINDIEKRIDTEKIKEFYKTNPEYNVEIKEPSINQMNKIDINNANKDMFEKVSKSEIKKASQLDIVKLATIKGYNLNKVGKNFYIDNENHNLTFNADKNTYYDKENKVGGNPIVFLRKQENQTFISAVKHLNELYDDEVFKSIKVEQNKLPISEEQLKNAENKSILDVASEFGYSFRKSGNYYIGIEHDSLVLNASKNTYNWYSKQEYGNPINFVQNEKSIDFVDAVNYLNNKDFIETEVKEEKIEYDKSKFNYREKEEMNVTRDYLINKRMINEELVNQLIEHDYIKEDKMKNVCFQWKNQEGDIVGSDKCGTGKTKFKGIDKGSDFKNAFNFSTTDMPEDIYVFESPIDAMSYKSLNKEKDGIFVSMNGLKQEAVKYQIAYYIKRYDKNPKTIHLCVDNDTAGNEFINKLQNQHLISNKTGEELIFRAEQPKIEDGKDWNEVLVKHKLNNLDNINSKDKHKTIKKEVNKKEGYTLEI